MKKAVLLTILIFIPLLASANGGPIIGISYFDINPLNDYISNYGIPPMVDHCYLLGGMGTNWFTDTFGIGFQLCGGTRMNFDPGFSSYASLTLMIGIIHLENIVYRSEDEKIQVNFKFGPGFKSAHFVMVSAGAGTEYAIDNILFNVGIGTQILLSEVFKFEFAINAYHAPQDRWIGVKGTAPQPPATNMNALDVSFGIRFGS